MKAILSAFTDDFSGKVFMIFSLKRGIDNPATILQIKSEIERLSA